MIKRKQKSNLKKKGNSTKAMVNKLVNAKLNKNIEKKFMDVTFNNSVSTGGTFVLLTSTSLGTTDSSMRVGDQIKLHSLQIRGQLQNADNWNYARIIVFRWNVNNVFRVPQMLDILQDLSYPWLSPYRFDAQRQGLFTIFKDKVIQTDNDDPTAKFKFNLLKKLNSRIDYDGGTGDGKGHIYVLMVTDSAAVTHPAVVFLARTVFTDA